MGPARCWLCGVSGTWFTCGCKEAMAARDGKGPKPRFVKQPDGRTAVFIGKELRWWHRGVVMPPKGLPRDRGEEAG